MLSAAVLMMLGSMLYSLRLSGGSFPKPLSAKEEKHYLELAAKGDLEARNVLIERNLRLVAHIMNNGASKKRARPVVDRKRAEAHCFCSFSINASSVFRWTVVAKDMGAAEKLTGFALGSGEAHPQTGRLNADVLCDFPIALLEDIFPLQQQPCTQRELFPDPPEFFELGLIQNGVLQRL